ncbi:MAG TPA: hypothetical protein VHB21_02970 [Minicystis sp.]|nr:hypothetical protein [Minicystis sp.]
MTTPLAKAVLSAVFAALAAGCSAEVGPVAAAPAADPLVEARRAAEVAFANLRNRNFPLDGCDPAQVRIAPTERDGWTLSNGGAACTVFAFHRASGQWAIAVRSALKASNPQARVIVAPTLAGVQRVDYAR